MLCCLCLEQSVEFLNIYENYLDKSLATIITKHFWFEPEKDTFKSDFICFSCMQIINNFHEFYFKIEQAHNIFETNLVNAINSRLDEIIQFKGQIDNDNCIVVSDDLQIQSTEPNLDEIIQSLVNCDEENAKIIENENEKVSEKCDDISNEIVNNKNIQKLPNKRPKKFSKLYDIKVSSFMDLVCDICSVTLETFSKLKTHFENVHNTNGYAVCCGKRYFKRNLLIDHIETHMNPNHFSCPTCGKAFTNRKSRHAHMKTIHLPERKVYECQECKKTFTREYALTAHKKIHSPKEEWTYGCDQCDKIFACQTSLSSHKHYVHKMTRKVCDLCGKSVANTIFRKHQLAHTESMDSKVQCEICGTMLNIRYVKIHMRNHKEQGTDHICKHCGKKSPNSKALYKHIYEVHKMKKTVNCPVCDKSFKSRDSLNQHMPVHTGENNYLCPYCSKTFKFRSNTHDHKRKEHPKEYEEERRLRQNTPNTAEILTLDGNMEILIQYNS